MSGRDSRAVVMVGGQTNRGAQLQPHCLKRPTRRDHARDGMAPNNIDACSGTVGLTQTQTRPHSLYCHTFYVSRAFFDAISYPS